MIRPLIIVIRLALARGVTCILRGRILSSLDIRMLIMPDAKWIGRVPLELANFLCGLLSLGLQRNKIALPYPRLKRNMSSLVVAVYKYFRCDRLSRTKVTL
jgi:hypothetical protein